jgi:hypothetical protein
MFKKVVLSLIAAVLIFGGTAFAVQDGDDPVNGMFPIGTTFINPGGLGDALVYPYYNVRGMSTYFNVVNTDTQNKVVARVRFREAKRSHEILDFNLCLSPGDVWTGVVTDDGTRGRLSVMERHTPGTKTNPAIPQGGVAFKDSALGNPAVNVISADDTREGYFEIIGLIKVAEAPATSPQTDCPATTPVAGSTDVANSLFGAAYMLNHATGETFGYNATAIADFQVGPISSTIGNEITTMQSAISFADLNYALTKANLYGFYALDADVAGEAAYVVMFPTKRDSEVSATGVFDRDEGTACPANLNNVRIGLSVWDDAEHFTEDAPQFSPISTVVNDLCYEVNVIELASNTSAGRSNILNSGVEIDVSTGTFDRGWIDIDLTQEANHATSVVFNGGVDTTFGVPVIGLQLHSFGNGARSGMLPMASRTLTGISVLNGIQ